MRCGKPKPLFEFHKDARSKNGLQAWCKPCRKLYNRENKEVGLKAQLKYDYGIGLTDYCEMLTVQVSGCAICGGSNINGRRLSVDHCHATNKVRGLLCHGCNIGLGGFKDNTLRLRNAVHYLEKGYGEDAEYF